MDGTVDFQSEAWYSLWKKLRQKFRRPFNRTTIEIEVDGKNDDEMFDDKKEKGKKKRAATAQRIVRQGSLTHAADLLVAGGCEPEVERKERRVGGWLC